MGKDLRLDRRRRAAERRGAKPWRIALIVSQFNEAITSSLVRGARQALLAHGVASHHITELRVPGAFELPVAAATVASALRPDAMVALGCLIKGETPQYDAIGRVVAQGLTQVAVESKIPVTFGVIIADTAAQAKARAGGASGNRGQEAALAALELLDAFQGLTPARAMAPEQDG